MTDLESLKQLQQLYRSLSEKARVIAESADAGKIISDEAVVEAIHLLSEVSRTKKQCIDEINSTVGDRVTGAETIADLIELLDSHKKKNTEKLMRTKEIFNTFCQLSSDDSTYVDELNEHKTKILNYSDDDILGLDYDTEVYPYELFVECAKEAKTADTIANLFGYKLAFALAVNKIYIADNGSTAGINEAPIVEPKVANIEHDSNATSHIEPKGEKTETQTRAKSEKPTGQPKQVEEATKAKEQANVVSESIKEDKLQEYTAQADNSEQYSTFNFSSYGIELLDDSAFGELKVDSPKKTPKSASALIGDIYKKGGPGFKKLMSMIAKLALNSYAIVPEITRQLITYNGIDGNAPKKAEAMINDFDKAFEYLLRQGYFDRYYKDGDSDSDITLYSLTRAGISTLQKSTVQKELFGKTIKLDHSGKIETAADYTRHKLMAETASKLYGIEKIRSRVRGFKAIGGYAFCLIESEDDENKPECVILPAIITKSDNSEKFAEFFEQLKSWFEDGASLVILADDLQTARKWVGFYKNELELNEVEQLQLLYGTFSDEKIYTVNGESTTISGYLSTDLYEFFENIEFNDEDVDEDLLNNLDEILDELGIEEMDNSDHADKKAHPETANNTQDKISSNTQDDTPDNTPTDIPDKTPEEKLEPTYRTDSVGIAQSIIDSNPDSCDTVKIIPLITALLKESRIMEAAVLARTLAVSSNDPVQKLLSDSLIYATNLNLNNHSYSGETLTRLADNEGMVQPSDAQLFRFMRFATTVWAMCFPSHAYDHQLYNDFGSTLISEIDDLMPEELNSFKQLAAILADELKNVSFRIDGLGFSSSVLSLLNSDEVRQKSRADLSMRAGDRINAPRSSINIRGLETYYKDILGPTSDLGRCMRIIHEDNTGKEEIAFVTDVLSWFVEQGSKATISDSDVERFIDAQWEETRKKDNIKLKRLNSQSDARKLAKRGINARLDIMKDWLAQVDSDVSNVESSIVESMRSVKSRVDKLLTQFIKQADKYVDTIFREISAEQKSKSNTAKSNVNTGRDTVIAGVNLLRYAISRIKCILDGCGNAEAPWTYMPLLTTPHMQLDEDGYPDILPQLSEIRGFEPWRKMLIHITEPQLSYEEALTLITVEDQNRPEWYGNYGAAILINRNLHETTGMPIEDYSSSCRGARMDAENEEDSFKSDIRLKYAYGQIDESTKETVFNILEDYREYFLDSHYYANFKALLRSLRKLADDETAERRNIFETQMLELAEQEKLTEESAPMLRHIRAALNDDNFALAEDYINRLGKGEIDLSAEEQKVDIEPDFHAIFLECYDEYYKACDRKENRMDSLRNWGFRTLKKLTNRWSSPNESVKAERLLNNWIAGKGNFNTNSLITNLLNQIGFTVTKTERRSDIGSSEQYEVFRARVTPLKSNLKDYAHPVFQYGTALNEYMNIVCLYGCKGTSTLISIMTRRLQLNGPTIVLMDGILSLAERRTIAATFKAMTSGQNSFLLIDRVLLLFLASLDEGDRMVALLRCTLPYTFLQLFSKGVGAVADEMFIGRNAEMNDICSENGPCLVYGGRQLGKTALLQRARSVQHQPEEKMYAVYVEIRNKQEADLLKVLQKELRRVGLDIGNCETFEDLCDNLYSSFSKGKISRLQIFVDESDAFFEESAQQEYENLTPVINLMRDTKKKIKFVFAGLHNVAHTSSAIEKNGLLMQFGNSLCISPLSPTDSRKLIERPLSYLGFKIGPRQLALILANTNSYPGLLHLFGYSLVQSVCDHYARYYSEKNGNPPYYISDEQLKAIFIKEDMEKEINWRIHSTINNLDERYRMVANIIAYLNYEDKAKGTPSLYGYSPETIRHCIDIPCLAKLSDEDFLVLLEEMKHMGILWSKPGSNLYRLRKQEFLGVIGSYDQVETTLLSASSEEHEQEQVQGTEQEQGKDQLQSQGQGLEHEKEQGHNSLGSSNDSADSASAGRSSKSGR